VLRMFLAAPVRAMKRVFAFPPRVASYALMGERLSTGSALLLMACLVVRELCSSVALVLLRQTGASQGDRPGLKRGWERVL
jgi:hypothetical protein